MQANGIRMATAPQPPLYTTSSLGNWYYTQWEYCSSNTTLYNDFPQHHWTSAPRTPSSHSRHTTKYQQEANNELSLHTKQSSTNSSQNVKSGYMQQMVTYSNHWVLCYTYCKFHSQFDEIFINIIQTLPKISLQSLPPHRHTLLTYWTHHWNFCMFWFLPRDAL